MIPAIKKLVPNVPVIEMSTISLKPQYYLKLANPQNKITRPIVN